VPDNATTRARGDSREPPRHVVRPDGVVVGVLAVIAVALFRVVSFPPDLPRDRSVASGAVAEAPPGRVQDFAFVFNYARRAVERPGVSPYTDDAHRDFFRAWLGPRVHSALCFTFGPTTMLLLAPLFPLSTAWAWLVWNLASAWLAGWAVRALPEGDPRPLGLARLAVVSATGFNCLVNGQTGLFTTGCLAAVMHLGDAPRPDTRRALACAVFLFALTVKPPFAVIAALALLVARRVRPLVFAAILGVAGAVAMTVWWTPTVLADYASLLGRYNLVDADEIVRAGLLPTTMSNLRSVLLRTGWLDDAQAFRASGWVLVAALVPPMLGVIRRRAWSLDLAMSWVVVAYLLFAPHLSPTEDLLLLVPLVRLARDERIVGWRRAAVVLGCLGPQWVNASGLGVLQLLHAERWIDAMPVVAFVAKLAPAVVIAGAAGSDAGDAGDAAPARQGDVETESSPRRRA
jgi:hypothetical protein